MNKRRADLTFKHNLEKGRHGWLRLTPAYSLKMVERYLPVNGERQTILDPFSGSGTTPLFASHAGHDALALELNPFLVWFAKVKTSSYTKKVIERLREIGCLAIEEFKNREAGEYEPPPIHNIQRWWSDAALQFLCSIKWSIEERRGEEPSGVLDLLYVVFCRTLIKISNAAFNHQSMSFNDDDSQPSLFEIEDQFVGVFESDLSFVAKSAQQNPLVNPEIIRGDAREVSTNINRKVDLVITSPPYPNRMSYIRELRPYMYWTEYLVEASEAGELDWDAIGGTWGVATSRLVDWEADFESGYYPDYLIDALKKIRSNENRNGVKMANYVARYFEDLLKHFRSLTEVLAPGAKAHYVIGNSTFYGVLIPAEKLYKEIMETVGFEEVNVEIVRKRNSKKELYEFTVSGTYGR